jgi:hypothetical protein
MLTCTRAGRWVAAAAVVLVMHSQVVRGADKMVIVEEFSNTG